MILLDTNVLGRMTNSRDPQCALARRAAHAMLSRGEQLVVVPQNLFEFWTVATRSTDVNGLGLTVSQASQWLAFFRRRFTLLVDRAELLSLWHDLVSRLAIRGFRAHDARLVAAMKSYGIDRILTFNGTDFRGFGVTIVDPAAV